LPEHWREYASYVLCGDAKNQVVRALSALDTGRASEGELRRVEQFAAAIKRAHQQTVGVKLKEEDFVPNLNWKLAH
jgi:cellobiose-specific phosphotransferase system component IIA